MDYFEFYKLLIKTIADVRPLDTEDLINTISNSKIFSELSESIGEEEATCFVRDVFENLHDDELIKVRQIPIDGVWLYEIDKLTTEGYLYLDTLKKPGVTEKIKTYALEEGLAPTPQNITKLLAKIAWE